MQKLGSFVALNNIAIKSLKNDSPDTRVGVVVGLKYSKKAVERNQVKRLIRDIVQAELKTLDKGWDIVIMARKRAEERSGSINFKKNILEALEKGGMLLNKKPLK